MKLENKFAVKNKNRHKLEKLNCNMKPFYSEVYFKCCRPSFCCTLINVQMNISHQHILNAHFRALGSIGAHNISNKLPVKKKKSAPSMLAVQH
jgi:hypothetical protein